MPKNQYDNPPSLLQYFDPPDHFDGRFGWMIGYSAGIEFLNMAAERFSGRTSGARQGVVQLALMLDKGHPQIPIVNTPGVLHVLQTRTNTNFKLLHAKIAILYFRHGEDDNKWLVRLLVCTGNWTRDTLSASLDLITTVEFSSEDLRSREQDSKQRQADLYAAWDLMKHVRQFFQTEILTGKQKSDTAIYARAFEDVLDKIRKPRAVASRFFDNRSSGLLHQLPGLISASSRDILFIGSGFFQESLAKAEKPTAIYDLVQLLQNKGLLKKKPAKYLIVNPGSCQGIAFYRHQLEEDEWNIRRANDPLERTRSLHAKFIFSGKREGKFIKKGWLYLGSGNITKPGFINRCSTNGGNLEAGMILSVGTLCMGRETDGKRAITSLLPIGFDQSSFCPEVLEAGEVFDSDREPHFAAPVAFFTWLQSSGEGYLIPDEKTSIGYKVFRNETPIKKDERGYFIWPMQERPLSVKVKSNKGSVEIPVFDESGYLALRDQGLKSIEEAWYFLEKYPGNEWRGEDGMQDAIEDALYTDSGDGETTLRRHRTGQYPIRIMMKFLEDIASKQTKLRESDWKIWCNRLEQSLMQLDESELKIFRDMGVNPLSPLRQVSYVPVFAEKKTSEAGKYYRQMLDRVEAHVDLKKLTRL